MSGLIPIACAPDVWGATVMRVADGVVERVPVTLGIRDGGLIGVTEGLGEGDLVVTKAGAFVRDGDRINPVHEDEDTASAATQGPATSAASQEE